MDTKTEAVERWHEEIHGMAKGSALFDGQQEYVRYADYQALAAELAAAVARAEAAEAKLAVFEDMSMVDFANYQTSKSIKAIKNIAALEGQDD